MKVSIDELRDLSKFSLETLEEFRDDAMLSIGALKQKLLRLPKEGFDSARAGMVSAKIAYGTVHQLTMAEIGRRMREARKVRALELENAFMGVARNRLPAEVFDELLSEAEEVAK